MLANIFIIAFVFFMAYWWGSRGMFSAVLHLASVIIAGALAFALWEPITVGILLGRMPPHAWGIGLLGPFIILLLVVRTIFDKTIKGNLHVSGLTNMLAGGFAGFLSGILVAGMGVIGLGFMSVGDTVGGYQPYAIGGDGNVIENPPGTLWIGVDRYTAGFFNKLSTGAFSTRTPLKYYQPDVARQAGLFRIHFDQNSSLVAMPGSVSINEVHAVPTPYRNIDDSLINAVGEDLRVGAHMLISIETHWKLTPGTYDGDSTLRISPPQVQLITRPKDNERGDRKTYRPIGASRREGPADASQWQYVPFVDDVLMIAGVNPEDDLTFFFLYPATEQPLFVEFRQLRIPLEQVGEDGDRLAAQFGKIAPHLADRFTTTATAVASADGAGVPPGPDGAAAGGNGADQPTGTVGDRQGMKTGAIAEVVEATNALPENFSRNVSRNLELQKDAVVAGRAEVPRAHGQRISPANAVREFYMPSHRKMVRFKIDQDAAQSLLGRTRVTAAQAQAIWITDDAGVMWEPVAYVWMKAQNMEIRMDAAQPIKSAKQVPFADLRPDQRLYLYFYVNPGAKIVSYNVGKTKQDVDLQVPK